MELTLDRIVKMTQIKISERIFLKELALQSFNKQRNQNVKSEDCDIQSIPPEYGRDLGYEIVTIVLNDFVRLRIYLNIKNNDVLQPFSLKVSSPYEDHSLDDEVFVALGMIDEGHRFKDGYSFLPLKFDNTILPIITTTNNEAILLSNGGYLLLA